MKRILKTLTFAFSALGLMIFVWDALTYRRYGFRMNEVAGITESGDPIDWPTGEVPLLFQVPIWIYAVGFWVSAAVAFALNAAVRKPYFGRVWRGAE